MNPYSVDLRERVVAKVREGASAQTDIADAFEVSDATVENWWHQWRETGRVEPKPFAGGAPRTLKACDAVIRTLVQQQPDAPLQELCDAVEAQTGLHSSPSMMCRELQFLNLPRKKVAARQSTRHATRASPAPRVSRARG